MNLKYFIKYWPFTLVVGVLFLSFLSPLIKTIVDDDEYSYSVPKKEDQVLADTNERIRLIEDNLTTIEDAITKLVDKKEKVRLNAQEELYESFEVSYNVEGEQGIPLDELKGDQDILDNLISKRYQAKKNIEEYYQLDAVCQANRDSVEGTLPECDYALRTFLIGHESIVMALEYLEEYKRSADY